MDLVYTRKFDGFCLVTSDSDFTGLAMRIREEGLTVLGFGEQKTPDAFRNACHKFVFTEVLRPAVSLAKVPAPAKAGSPKKVAAKAEANEPAKLQPPFPQKFILDALEHSCDEAGWANLAALGSYLTKLQPDFDSRMYGFKKLSDLVKTKANVFETEERSPQGSTKKILYVRAK